MSVPTSSSSKAAGVINIPAFITKLWMLVEDKDTDKLIKWSQDGNSFIVYDPSEFAKDILPKVFKHNNMPSFVRQLNMYGFRKKMQPEQGALIRTAESNQIEFYHQHFVKGHQKQLELIKRKISGKDDLRLHPEGVNTILKDVEQMKSKQDGITGKLNHMQRENEALWREVMFLRKRHEQQQKIVSRLIQFLLTLAQQKNPLKRTQLPMIEAGLDTPSRSKYSKLDELLQSDPEILSEQPVTMGATLSEVEDLPPEILGPALSSDLPVIDDLGVPIEREEVPADIGLDEMPIITSPGGHQINSPVQGDSTAVEVTGQILPVSNPTGSQVLMPQVPQDQQSISHVPALQRTLSVEEQKQEIGEQVTGIQTNLEFIQNLLEASPRFNAENLWEIFRTDEVGNSHDFLSTLADSNGLNNVPNTSNITGTEIVQYQPTNIDDTLPSTIFTEEDENSLLTSLDEDARNLVPSGGSKEDEGEAT